MSRLSKILFLLAGLSLVSFVVVQALLGAWVPFLWVALGLFAGFLVGGIFVDRSYFREFLGMKTTKQGMSMGAMIGLVLILMLAVNFIAARKYVTWDLSQARVNTLSDQSVKLIKGLEDDLRVIYFYKDGTDGVDQNRRLFIDLIKKYQDQSPRVKLEFVEINQRPDLTEKYHINKGTQAVLLDYKERTSLVEKIDEQELTSALVKVTREKDKKVFLLSGHGELGVTPSEDGLSISILKQLLEGNRYKVETFSLTTVPAIPADADVVIVPGPKQGFIDVEIKALEDYLRRGGSLILAVKPKANHHLDSWLAKLGVQPQNNYLATVLDTPMGRAVDPRFTRGSVFSKQNKITAPFGKSEFTVFHLPQNLKIGKASAGIKIDPIVETNETAMAYKDPTFQSVPEKGPFTLGVEISGTYPGAVASAKENATTPGATSAAAPTAPPTFSMLVFGDSDFLNDQYLYQNLNRDLFLNSVAALAKEENLISISPKEVQATPMSMSDTGFILFVFGFVIPLPLLLFTASGVIWFRRRHA